MITRIAASEVGPEFLLEAPSEVLAVNRAAIREVLAVFDGSRVLGVRQIVRESEPPEMLVASGESAALARAPVQMGLFG